MGNNPFLAISDNEKDKEEKHTGSNPYLFKTDNNGQSTQQHGIPGTKRTDELMLDSGNGFDFSLADGTSKAEAPETDYREQYAQMVKNNQEKPHPTLDIQLEKQSSENESRKRQAHAISGLAALSRVAAATANFAISDAPAITLPQQPEVETHTMDENYRKMAAANDQIKKRNEQIIKNNERVFEKQMEEYDKRVSKTTGADKSPIVKPNYKSANINGQHYTYDSNTFTDDTVLSLYDRFFGTPTDYKPTPTEKREMLLRYAQLPEYSDMRKTLENNGVTFTEYFKPETNNTVTMSEADKKKYSKEKPSTAYTPHDNTRHVTVNDTKFDYDPNKVPDDTWLDIYGEYYGEWPQDGILRAKNRLFNDAVYDNILRAKLKSYGIKIKDSNNNRLNKGNK